MKKRAKIGKGKINKKTGFITCGSLVGLIILCGLIGMIYNATPAGKAAATARAQTETAKPTKTIIPSRTLKPTETILPSKTIKPSSSISLTKSPTSTQGAKPTDTRWPTATEGAIQGGSSSGCNCSRNMDCQDFGSHAAAQACFESCGGSASNNWANLDGRDHDGIVCENLP